MDNHAIWEKIYTDRPEDVYVHSANFRWEAYLTRSILKNILEIDSVIDVGCGEGIKTRLLSDIFPDAKIIGVDLSETGIEKAKNTTQNENIQYIHDDVTSWCYNRIEVGLACDIFFGAGTYRGLAVYAKNNLQTIKQIRSCCCACW